MSVRTREPRSSIRRLGLAFVCAVALAAPMAARPASADPATTAPADASKPTAKPTKKTTTKTTTKPVTKKKKKAPPDGGSAGDATAKAAAKRRRVNARPAYLVGDSDAHLINEAAPRVATFPQDAKAIDKAFAENRRDQLVDAEKAARAEKSPDRWHTVLFMLHGLPDTGDPEACFWRVLSFYRLGEIDRGRAVRSVCDLPAKDSSTLNAEDALASRTPAMGTVARDDQWTAPAPGVVTDPDAAVPPPPPPVAPYTGPGPQHYP